MAKVLVLYYSMYGHIETMANAVADGAKSVSGSEVTIKRVPETIPAEQAAAFGAKLDQDAAVATPAELADYDAIIFARRPVSATWLRRCATSSIRPAGCG